MKTTGLTGLVVTGAALLASGALHAQETATVETLDQRIRILERQLELQQETADTKAKDATTAAAGDKGYSLKKGDYELKIKGLIQADARVFLDDAAPRTNDTFILRRLRPTFEGSLGKLVGFRLTPEFAGDSATIVDAYLDAKFDPAFTLRVGKVKGPVALERLQSGGAISFVERGFPTELAPNRDLGLQVQGDLLSGTLNYTLGYYNGTADGRDATTTDVDNRKEVGARLFVEPFKNSPGIFQGLGFGVGSSFGSKEQGAANSANANSFLPRYRSPGQNTVFSYRTTATAATAAVAGTTGVYADGDQIRYSPQLYWYYNGIGLLGEYISSKQDVSIGTIAAGPGATTTTTASLENTAWQVAATYVLSGEDASFRGVSRVANPYTVDGEGWGAWEVAARYGVLEIDDEAFPRYANPATAVAKATSYSLGLNWYLTSNLKIALNYTDTAFEGGAAGGADREDEQTVFTRFQVAF